MASELLTGLGLFKSVLDAAKQLKGINDATVRNAAIIELQEKILSAIEQQMRLDKHVGELEEEITRYKTWDAEKKRYELKEIASGQFVYSLKESARENEPTHMLCSNCYNHNQKSILQTEIRFPGCHTVIFCQACDSDLFSPETGGRNEHHPIVQKGVTWGRGKH